MQFFCYFHVFFIVGKIRRWSGRFRGLQFRRIRNRFERDSDDKVNKFFSKQKVIERCFKILIIFEIFRRLKDDVMSQLQPKKRNVFVLDKSLIELEEKSLDTAKRTFYDESIKVPERTSTSLFSVRKIFTSMKKLFQQMEKRGALLKFYNETAKAKTKAVSDHILSLLKNGRKMVVFAHHQSMMDALQEIIVSEVIFGHFSLRNEQKKRNERKLF